MRKQILLAWLVCLITSTPASAQANWLDEATAAYLRKDYSTSLSILRPEADRGHAIAQYNLGRLILLGLGTSKDPDEAWKWIEASALQGYAPAEHMAGAIFSGLYPDISEQRSIDGSRAAEWFRRAARQGHGAAQNDLGLLYARGVGVEQDFTEAIRWFRHAAVAGVVQALHNLGVRYLNGEGVKADLREAFTHFEAAAQKGFPESQYQVGLMYAEGQHVDRDIGEAYRWFLTAAENGQVDAQNRIGIAYLGGLPEEADDDGIVANDVLAYYWFHRAAARKQALGGQAAAFNLETARGRMSPEQIAEAEALLGKQ